MPASRSRSACPGNSCGRAMLCAPFKLPRDVTSPVKSALRAWQGFALRHGHGVMEFHFGATVETGSANVQALLRDASALGSFNRG